MNIVAPSQPSSAKEKYPVIFWVHGGSLLHGSANYGIYDVVNFVSHSVDIGHPVVAVNFNYRLGLGGFLASKQIATELRKDGFDGNGNFGLTDQRVAAEWVQTYIEQFGGDRDNVCAIGHSAGAISIGYHLAAAYPLGTEQDGPRAPFHRAVCMSGLGSTLLCLSPEEHQDIFDATCRFFSIDSSAHDALDRLREIPEQSLADADPIIQGVPSGTGYPCLDGWFYAHDPREIIQTPQWLRSFLFGDVHDEGLIFEVNLAKDTYQTIREILLEQVEDEDFVDAVLEAYGIVPYLPSQEVIDRTCEMGAEAVFKIQNYRTAIVNTQLENRLFKYHFDQRSDLSNALQGRAYHGLDVLYLFMNLDNKLSESQRKLSRSLASAWISSAWGQMPWPSGIGHGPWKLWGPDSKEQVETEGEDEKIRSYSRFDRILQLASGDLWERYMRGLSYLIMKRGNLGKFIDDAEDTDHIG